MPGNIAGLGSLVASKVNVGSMLHKAALPLAWFSAPLHTFRNFEEPHEFLESSFGIEVSVECSLNVTAFFSALFQAE